MTSPIIPFQRKLRYVSGAVARMAWQRRGVILGEWRGKTAHVADA
jgi:hypothetical protein